MNSIALDVQNLTKSFGGLMANDQISFQVEEEEIIGIIGPNGAGKTTLFNMISAVSSEGGGSRFPDAGQVFFRGKKITRLFPNEICKLGLARTFQIVKIMRNVTIFDSVMIGALNRARGVSEAKDITSEMLEFTHLWDLRNTPAGSVPIASQKRLEMARALATQPALLMLDEPMAGLTPKEVEEAVALVKRIHERKITVLMVEHVMKGIMPIADRIIVLDNGKIIAMDTPREIVEDEGVNRAYFGE